MASTAESAPASLGELAAMALAVLERDGGAGPDGLSVEATAADGTGFRIALRGPDLPVRVPATIAPPDLVRASRGWRGAYRLAVRVPVTVLELEWNPDEPARVFAFSRGAWEDALAALAAPRPRAAR
jgi:hypothetical protein